MGFLGNLKDRSTSVEALRWDLRECAEKLTGARLRAFLSTAGPTGYASPPEVPEAETFLAVFPCTRRWEEGDYRYDEMGSFYLTTERLFWRTGDGGFEVPLRDLRIAGLRTESQRWAEYLHIGIGPSSNPSYRFDVGDRKISGEIKDQASYEHFLETLKATVRAFEGSGGEDTPTDSTTSAADELAKFAKLHADGVINDEEFAEKKKQLLR
jgi:hypothetical protein